MEMKIVLLTLSYMENQIYSENSFSKVMPNTSIEHMNIFYQLKDLTIHYSNAKHKLYFKFFLHFTLFLITRGI